MTVSDARRRIAHYVGIICADKKVRRAHKRRWIPPSKFKYVIFSYRRAAVLKRRTWAYLKKCGIPDDRIMIVVQNEQCHRDYKDAGFPTVSLVKINTAGYAEAFNRVFAPSVGHKPLVGLNELCVQMDDDIVALSSAGRKMYPSGRPQPMQLVNLDAIILEQMEAMEASGCNLAGFCPCDNPGWVYKDTLKSRVADHLGLRFVIGSFRVIRNQGIRIELPKGKSDYEITVRYFQADGGIVRSSFQIRSDEYTGGTETQDQMAAAKLLQQKFPREIPDKPKEHASGTISLRLAKMTLGEGSMLMKMKQEMEERLGEVLCKKIFKQVEVEIAVEKKVERLKHEARKGLTESQCIPLLKKEYDALMISRYGKAFDADSFMVPFPMYSEQTYKQMYAASGQCGENADDGSVKALATKPSAIGVQQEKAVRFAVSELRSSARILEIARAAPDDDHRVEDGGILKRKNQCKACGELGHYAKRCPLRDPADIDALVRTRAEEMTYRKKSCCKRPAGCSAIHAAMKSPRTTAVRASAARHTISRAAEGVTDKKSTCKRPAGEGTKIIARSFSHKRPARVVGGVQHKASKRSRWL